MPNQSWFDGKLCQINCSFTFFFCKSTKSRSNTQVLCISTSFRVLRAPKNWLKLEMLFCAVFNLFIFRRFFLISDVKLLKKVYKGTKILQTAQKKYFGQLSGACSTQKLVKIHNKQVHFSLTFKLLLGNNYIRCFNSNTSSLIFFLDFIERCNYFFVLIPSK